jgi:glycosyltransferase involved in cell wall biosynthesis
MPHFSFEIIIVGGRSSAQSPRTRSIFTRSEVCIIPAPNWNGDLEEARRAGILQARGEFIVCAPADGALRPSELMKLMKRAEEALCRRAPAKEPRALPTVVVIGLRGTASGTLNRLMRALAASSTGVTDPQSPARCLSRRAAQVLYLATVPEVPDRRISSWLRRVADVAFVLRARSVGVGVDAVQLRWTQVQQPRHDERHTTSFPFTHSRPDFLCTHGLRSFHVHPRPIHPPW